MHDQKPYYCGKPRRHGVNVQVLADPAGRLLWASPVLPGAAHDLTAARTHGLLDAVTSNDIRTLADKGYQGAGGTVCTPFQRHRCRPPLSRGQKAVNRAHARVRARGERAVATLTGWTILTTLRCCRAGPPQWWRPSSSCTTSRPAATHDENGPRSRPTSRRSSCA